MSRYSTTERNRIRRLPKRASYDQETINRILDEALICHIGIVENGQPFVIPTNFARLNDTILLHGSKASRMIKHVGAGHPVCVTVTILDGVVLARSIFHHSMNYRSAVLFGKGRLVEGDDEKLAALEAISEHIMPGRWREARLPNRREMKATGVVSIRIESASAKVRTGPPGDEQEDYGLPVWAGVLPLEQTALPPLRDELLRENVPIPSYVSSYSRKRAHAR